MAGERERQDRDKEEVIRGLKEQYDRVVRDG